VSVLAGTLAITAWMVRSAQQELERDLRAYFEYRVRDAESRIAQRMSAHEQVLRGAAGLFAASGHVERDEFRDYVSALRLEEHHPGIQGLGFSVLVPAASREAHTAAVRREGFPGYSIRPGGDREPLSSIVYLEPFGGRNLRAFGYDMFSEPVRRAAMEQARDSGQAVLSGKVTLVQETERDVQAGALMYLPIYRGGARDRTLAERRADLVGWVYSPFRMTDLMHGIFGERGSDLDVEIFDGTEPSAESLMYDGDGEPLEGPRGEGSLESTHHLVIANRPWTVVVRPLPVLTERVRKDRPRAVALTGTITSVLLALLVWTLARGRTRAVREALELAREVAERERAEEALRESEARVSERAAELEAVLDAVPAAVMITHDRDARTIESNRLGHELLRVTAGANVSKTAAPGDAPTHFRIFQDGAELAPAELPIQVAAARHVTVANAELKFLFDDGTVRHLLGNARPLVDGRGEPNGAVGAFVDITELKQAQARLMQSDRLASVGMLAAGVAHEINNPLAYVVASLNFLDGELTRLAGASPDAFAEMRQALAEARDGARRVTHVVRDLKTFARADEEHRTLVDLPSAIESAINLASAEIKYRARVVRSYGPVLPVHANEARLGQVFVNLLVNAAQAIAEGHVEENEIRVSTSTDPLGRAVVEIRDSGPGIPREIIGHVFDPFFTTKPVNVGTGLGLTICRNIVSALGGEIAVESPDGCGAVIRVALPAACSLPEPEPSRGPADRLEGRRGRVLVVDDEPAIAQSLQRLLSADHEVKARTSAREALGLIENGEHFDAIVCDLIMPNMTGMELHTELTRIAPDQARRLIVLTGGAFTPRATQFLDSVPNARLEKPFDPDTLRRTVRACVGEGPRRAADARGA
jgi:C4-dicarboxylate-specific signal transduction histidine kinase/ActR/RegA family two-component response regulator